MSAEPGSVAAKGEVLKVARLLRRDPSSLEYLERVDPDDLRVLREQVTEMLFSAHAGALGRLATASKLLPVSVIASIAQRALGPVVTARIAGMLEPARAVEVAAKLPCPFLADVAAEIDPRRAGEVVALIPPDQIVEVTAELVRRGEYVTVGRFVGRLGAGARLGALQVIDTPTLVRVAFVVEDHAGLCQLFEDIPPARRPGLIEAAAGAGLSAELLQLVARLPDPLRRAYEELAAAPR
jgi:hypothetical protein